MTRWFRMYTDVLDDPKVQKLPPALFKTWVNLLCLASRHEGALPDVEDIAFALRMDEEACGDQVRELVERGLIDAGDGLRPHNWDARQFKSDTAESAAERKRAQRAREKQQQTVTTDKPDDVTVTRCDSHGDVTPPEQIQIQIQKQSREETARDELASLEAKLREAAGWQNEPAPGLFITGPIQALLDNGASLEIDVLPTIRSRAKKIKAQTWKYFVPAIQDAMEARRNAGTGPPSSSGNVNAPPQKSFDELRKEILPGWNPGTKFASSIG